MRYNYILHYNFAQQHKLIYFLSKILIPTLTVFAVFRFLRSRDNNTRGTFASRIRSERSCMLEKHSPAPPLIVRPTCKQLSGEGETSHALAWP